MFMPWSSFLTVIVFAWVVMCPASFAASRLPAVKRIRQSYAVETDRLSVSWQAVAGASAYTFSLRSLDGVEVVSRRTSSPVAKVSGKLLSDSQQYTVEIQAVAGSRRSLLKRKSFIFSTRVASAEEYHSLEAVNGGGRKGWVFLPKNYRLNPLPAMLLFHGSSIDGKAQLDIFKSLARKNKLIVLAPDSINSAGWELSLDPSKPSGDQAHIAQCLSELLAIPPVSISRFLVAGVSAGGAVAAYYGSHDLRYSAMAVLHGGVDISSLGANRVPVWLSTGSEDTLRPPAELQSYQRRMQALNFPEVLYREFSAGHEVNEDERLEMFSWFLGSHG